MSEREESRQSERRVDERKAAFLAVRFVAVCSFFVGCVLTLVGGISEMTPRLNDVAYAYDVFGSGEFWLHWTAFGIPAIVAGLALFRHAGVVSSRLLGRST